MSILGNVKLELFKAPLATAIGLLALVIALWGSPFEEGGFLKPEKPRVVIGGQFSAPNHNNGYGAGAYATHVLFDNKGTGDVEMRAHVFLLTEDNRQIDVLNDDGQDTATTFSMMMGSHKGIVATSNERPKHLIVCSNAIAVSSGDMREFNAAYSLMAQEPKPGSLLKYKTSTSSRLSEQIELCSAKLQAVS